MIESARLQAFEAQFDPLKPEAGAMPARILGYGEISTVLAIDALDGTLAFKRMPMFVDEAEADAYVVLYHEAMGLLAQRVGLQPVSGDTMLVWGPDGRPVIYLIQPKLNPQAIASQALHRLPAAEQERLFTAVFHEVDKVFRFNQAYRGRLEMGMDGQLSNWVISDYDGTALPDVMQLAYLDTSSPLMQKEGVEQLDPELFLRSALSFMRWIIRWLFLADVLMRYYDQRLVIIDLIANLYKEQLPDLVPRFVTLANGLLADAGQPIEPIRLSEVQAYYREDALIWQVYLTFRRIDRFLHRLWRKRYPYVLPGRIRR